MNFLFTGQLYTSGTYKLLKCTNAIVKHFALVFLSIIHFNQICPSNQYAKRWVHNKRNSTVSTPFPPSNVLHGPVNEQYFTTQLLNNLLTIPPKLSPPNLRRCQLIVIACGLSVLCRIHTVFSFALLNAIKRT